MTEQIYHYKICFPIRYDVHDVGLLPVPRHLMHCGRLKIILKTYLCKYGIVLTTVYIHVLVSFEN